MNIVLDFLLSTKSWFSFFIYTCVKLKMWKKSPAMKESGSIDWMGFAATIYIIYSEDKLEVLAQYYNYKEL